jgi:nitrogen fixation NifU-like protein
MSTRQEQLGFILKHAEAPQHYGPLPDPSITVRGGGGECGESITLYLSVDEDRIADASFEAEGTTIGRAAASVTTETIIGKTLDEVLQINPNEIVDTLGREIVGDRLRAATITLDTAKAAARKYLGRERQGEL